MRFRWGSVKVHLGCVILTLALTAGCASDPSMRAEPNQSHEPEEDRDAVVVLEADQDKDPQRATLVDPKRDGLEVVLGEWALSPEARVIRPGKVTFVVRNRGTMAHGFEIALEGESSGHGSGDLFKAEGPLLRPGSTTRMTMDLGPGVYEIECLVDGHDDMGMEGVLEVRADAPLTKVPAPEDERPDLVAIKDFNFTPSAITVPAGTELTWTNDDVAPHTVSATSDEFDSDTLNPGDSFSVRLDSPGTFDYRCLIHPDMKGSVKVR